MPVGWRIVKATRAANAFDGEGARLYGGRWNGPGTAMVYTAGSESLAVLEVLVHLQASQILMSYSSISATFGRELVTTLTMATLPADWYRFPAPVALQEIGDRWAVSGRSAVLRVPSAVVPTEKLYLLNPNHPDYGRMKIGAPVPLQLDARLK